MASLKPLLIAQSHKVVELESLFERNVMSGLEKARADVKRLEKLALEHSQRYEKIFRHSSHGIAVVALDGKLLAVNDAVCKIWERPRYELKKLRWQDITHEDDIEADENRVDELAHGDVKKYDLQKRYRMPDGRYKWCLLTVTAIVDEQHKPIYFISQIQDLEQQKKRLEEAEEIARRRSGRKGNT